MGTTHIREQLSLFIFCFFSLYVCRVWDLF